MVGTWDFQMLFAYLTAFICGFCLMALEILGGRALSPYFGFTLHVWGAVISVFLGAMSIGYAAGSRLERLGLGRHGLLRCHLRIVLPQDLDHIRAPAFTIAPATPSPAMTSVPQPTRSVIFRRKSRGCPLPCLSRQN